MKQVGNTWTFHVTGMAKQEGDQWTSWCPELDIAAQGDTLQEAMDSLLSSVHTYVQHMVQSGRVAEIVRPAPPEAYHEFLTAGGADGTEKPVQVSSRALELTTA